MSTIYEIQKLPGDSDERPFIIAQKNALDAVPLNSVVSFTERFYRRSGFGVLFRNAVCSPRSGWRGPWRAFDLVVR
jgi:hypothetical protein